MLFSRNYLYLQEVLTVGILGKIVFGEAHPEDQIVLSLFRNSY